MAAGLGFKEFTTGDVLTAADANGYLASQVVMVFASAAARTSAIASPQEGMISFLKDTNSTEYYSGSAWVAIGGSSGGMTLLSTTTLTTSSHTISTISQDYKHLVFYCKGITSSGSSPQNLCLRLNGDTGSNYQYSSIRTISTTVSGVTTADTGIQFIDRLQSASTVAKLGSAALWVYRYTDTDQTDVFSSSFGNDGTNGLGQNLQANYNCTAAITSATFYNSAGGNLGGTIYTYGVN